MAMHDNLRDSGERSLMDVHNLCPLSFLDVPEDHYVNGLLDVKVLLVLQFGLEIFLSMVRIS
jgi:hypothetical protein